LHVKHFAMVSTDSRFLCMTDCLQVTLQERPRETWIASADK
jgi:hypothetical protein